MSRLRGFEAVAKEHMKAHDVRELIELPKRGTASSAGYDFVATYGVTIAPGESFLFWTDVKAYMQPGEVLLLDVRSSTGTKKDLMLKNTIGVIDTDYYENPDNDGNIGINLYNYGKRDISIADGERIVQGIFVPFLVADDDSAEGTREGGFGSTGK